MYKVLAIGWLCLNLGGAVAQEMPFFAFDSLRGTLARDHQPRAVYHGGQHKCTYVTYIDHFFDARVTCYDHDKAAWAPPVRVDDCRTRDGHNAPAILVTRDGTIHLFYGCHNHPVKYARSKRPEDITEWETGAEIGSSATYTYGIELENGDLLLFYRFGGSGRHSPLRVHRSADGGHSWDDGADIVDFEGDSWVKIRDALYDPEQNRVHLALWEGNNNYWCAFYAAYDPASRTILALNGTDVGPLATRDELLANKSRLLDKGRHPTFDMTLHDGTPYFVLSRPNEEAISFARWDAGTLRRDPLPGRKLGALELYTDDGETFRLYALCANEPPTGFSGNDMMVWTSADVGKTWDQGAVVLDRRKLGYGLTGLNITEDYPGTGPFIITQEEWLERSENLPREYGSILDDAPFRFNKKLFALDRDYAFVVRDLEPSP